jgi:O-phosphoseryl-tRNA(Cys) synthetase
MSEKVKPLNIINIVSSLLENGVDVDVIKDSFKGGGLSGDEVEYLIAYVIDLESSKAVNLFHNYMVDVKNSLNDVLNLLRLG